MEDKSQALNITNDVPTSSFTKTGRNKSIHPYPGSPLQTLHMYSLDHHLDLPLVIPSLLPPISSPITPQQGSINGRSLDTRNLIAVASKKLAQRTSA